MGYSRDQVASVVQRMADSGQPIDFNAVLDRLNGGGGAASQRVWLPLIGNLHQLGALPHRSLRALAAKHGPVMLLHLGRVPAVVISSAPAAQQAMKTNDLAFASRPEARIPNALLYGGDVAFSPYGEYWRPSEGVFNAGIILTESNYDIWSQLMEMQIAERDKISYIRGKTKPPAESDEGYEKWYAENQKVKRWLLMSMSPDIMRRYLRLPTAHSIWTALSTAFYDGSDELQVFTLNQKAFSARQNGRILSVYYGELTELFQELDHRDKVVMKDSDDVKTYRQSIERLRVHIFLAGLDEAFDSIRREILRKDLVPNLEECYSLVRREEVRSITLKGDSRASEPSAMVARNRSSQGQQPRAQPNTGRWTKDVDKSSYKCAHCHKTGHTKSGCFELGEYQEEIRRLDHDNQDVENLEITDMTLDPWSSNSQIDMILDQNCDENQITEEMDHSSTQQEIEIHENIATSPVDISHQSFTEDVPEPHRRQLPQRHTRGAAHLRPAPAQPQARAVLPLRQTRRGRAAGRQDPRHCRCRRHQIQHSRRQPACRQSHKRRHLRVAFGRKYSAEGGGAVKIQATLAELAALLGTVEIGEFVPWLGWIDRLRGLDRRVRNNSRELDAMLERVLEDHCSGNEEGDDLVDVLLSINDKDENVGIALTRSNIKALLLDMFAGGTDTAFKTIDWAMTELIKNPKVMERAQEDWASSHTAPRARWEARARHAPPPGPRPTSSSPRPGGPAGHEGQRPHLRQPPPARISNALLYSSDIAVSPYGEYWRQVRRICVLHLLSLKRVQSFRYVRQEEAALLVDKIRATVAAAATTSSTVDVSQLVVNLTNDVTCRVAFGRKYSAEGGGAAKIQATLAEFAALLGTVEIGEFVPWLGWIDRLRGLDRRVRNNSRELDAMLERVLEDHCSGNEEGDDLVDVLLSINDKDENVGIALTRSNIKALLLDMFAAGTDTTFTTIDWIMAELIKHPKVMERAQEEVRRVVGSSPNVEEELLEGMYYLKDVIKETLRLHAPIPLLVPRETIEDTQLEGFDIPAKTRVIINAWAIGRDPKLWERAEEFWPRGLLTALSISEDSTLNSYRLVREGEVVPGSILLCPSSS
uniref:DUF1421 domain-containing protein n=1 Tax=Ananas comosus var. bracteatus TaxID=296719 RepID=A0A6V7PUE6_ANACO|nr:unnamed protein product [Ananas comosus var. bracteatus]